MACHTARITCARAARRPSPGRRVRATASAAAEEHAEVIRRLSGVGLSRIVLDAHDFAEESGGVEFAWLVAIANLVRGRLVFRPRLYERRQLSHLDADIVGARLQARRRGFRAF